MDIVAAGLALQLKGLGWSRQLITVHPDTSFTDVLGQNRNQAYFETPFCIFRGNKCGLEGNRNHHSSRLVHVSLSYSVATVETPQDENKAAA